MSTARDILTRLGVSDFNATMLIQVMWSNPATTDPKSPAVMMLVSYLQRALVAVDGDRHGVQVTGRLDDATYAALESLVPGWLYQPWAKVTKSVVDFRDSGGTFKAGPMSIVATPMSGMPLGLPDVPGGLVTYAIGGYLAYRYFKRKR